MPKKQNEKKSPKDMKTKTALKSSITKAFKEFGDSDHPKDEFKKALSEEHVQRMQVSSVCILSFHLPLNRRDNEWMLPSHVTNIVSGV